MKKLLFAALLAVTAASGAFAADTKKVNFQAVQNFQSYFKNASDVSWSATGDFAKATFIVDKQKMEAFFDLAGEMIGTAKAITLDELSVNAKRGFAKKFEGYTVKEAIRFDGVEEVAYYISAENEKEAVILKVSDNGLMSNYSTTKK